MNTYGPNRFLLHCALFTKWISKDCAEYLCSLCSHNSNHNDHNMDTDSKHGVVRLFEQSSKTLPKLHNKISFGIHNARCFSFITLWKSNRF